MARSFDDDSTPTSAELWRCTLEALKAGREDFLSTDQRASTWRADLQDRSRWSDEALDPSTELGASTCCLLEALHEYGTFDPDQAWANSLVGGSGLVPAGFAEGLPGAWAMPWSYLLPVVGGELQHPTSMVAGSDSQDELASRLSSLKLFEAVTAFFVTGAPLRAEEIEGRLREIAARIAPRARVGFAPTGVGTDVWMKLDGLLVGSGAIRPAGPKEGGVLSFYLEPVCAIRNGRPPHLDRQPAFEELQAEAARFRTPGPAGRWDEWEEP